MYNRCSTLFARKGSLEERRKCISQLALNLMQESTVVDQKAYCTITNVSITQRTIPCTAGAPLYSFKKEVRKREESVYPN